MGDGWNITRPLGESDMQQWTRLMDLLDKYNLNDREDHFIWILEKSGRYSIRSMYRHLTFRDITNKRRRECKSRLPNKIKVFMWLVAQDRLQTGVDLKKKELERK